MGSISDLYSKYTFFARHRLKIEGSHRVFGSLGLLAVILMLCHWYLPVGCGEAKGPLMPMNGVLVAKCATGNSTHTSDARA